MWVPLIDTASEFRCCFSQFPILLLVIHFTSPPFLSGIGASHPSLVCNPIQPVHLVFVFPFRSHLPSATTLVHESKCQRTSARRPEPRLCKT